MGKVKRASKKRAMKAPKPPGEKTVRHLELEIRRLHGMLNEKHEDVKNRYLVSHMHAAENIRKRAEMNETLRKVLAEDMRQLEKMFILAAMGWVPVLVADKCTKEEMGALDKKYGLSDKWVLVVSDMDYTGTETLERARGAICTGRLYAIISRKGVPAINMDASGLERCGDLGVLRVDHVKIVAQKMKDFGSWVGDRTGRGQ